MNMISELEATSREERIRALHDIVASGSYGVGDFPLTDEVNNHVHTHYSFSPYSPTHAVFQAAAAGLQAVGSVDHDSIGAARELAEAAAILGVGSTVGYELRVNFSGSAVEGKRLNNPDSVNIAYIVVHGVPHNRIDEVARFLEPIQIERNRRNNAQVANLNGIIGEKEIEPLDFETDVRSLSLASEGGSITERHILYALSHRLISLFGKGDSLVKELERRFDLPVPGRIRAFLEDPHNPHYAYDLLGILKSAFLPRFFIQPTEKEAISVFDAVEFANGIGAIPAYSYLGDVSESPTGDKKAQQFEDSFLDELIPEVKRIGFRSVTYMPPRNSEDQLRRLQKLAAEADLMEISGVDINSSRQQFNAPEVLRPLFRHLNSTTWALIAHEKLSTENPQYGLFASDNPLSRLTLDERISRYASLGGSMDRHNPRALIDRAGELEQGV